MFAGRIDDSFNDDDIAFVVDFTRQAMKARVAYFQSSEPEYSIKFVKRMAAPSKNRSLAEIIALEKLAEAAIAWKNSEDDVQFDILYGAVEEFEHRQNGKAVTPIKERSKKG